MKQLLSLLLLILFSGSINAQSRNPVRDSVRYYRKQLDELRRTFDDSMRQTAVFKTATAQISSLVTNSDSYNAFVLYTSFSSADFSRFNQQTATAGFAPINGSMPAIGYGYSGKKERLVFDVNFSAFGLNRKTVKTVETLKTGFSTFFQLEWGYDLTKDPNLNVYPYAGIGLRSTLLQYEAPVSTNPSFGSPTTIVSNNSSFNTNATEAGYQVGLCVEVNLSKHRQPGGTMLFIKAGTNQPFSRKSFNIHGVQYNPQFNMGAFSIAAGFKFFGR